MKKCLLNAQRVESWVEQGQSKECGALLVASEGEWAEWGPEGDVQVAEVTPPF